MSKLLIFSLVAMIAVANARGLNGEEVRLSQNDVQNNVMVPLQKEGRFLLEVPLIGSLVIKSLKAAWFLLTTICSVVNFKLALLAGGVALALKVASWALSFKFPIIIGAVLLLGFCKVTGLCALHSDLGLNKVTDHLAYASDYLDMGTLKYGNSHSDYQ